MASLLYFKHSVNLSGEKRVVRWSENIVWHQSCGGLQPALAAARHCPAGHRGDFFAPVAGCVVGAIDDRNATAVSPRVRTWYLSNGAGAVEKPDSGQTIWAGF